VKLLVRAPGKVNVCLFVGPRREHGRHEVVTVLESVSLADELSVCTRAQLPDVVECDEVIECNLASVALERLRSRTWDGPPVRIHISKRIPVAGGMGGGSADAAAVLRLAQRLRPAPEQILAQLAAELGADVPSQLTPGLSLGTGAGDRVRAYPPLAAHALVLLPQPYGLSAREVYREADRLGLPRDFAALEQKRVELEGALLPGARFPAQLLVNDLEPAATSLSPQVAEALDAVREAGADQALVSGSGPTVLGLFWDDDGAERARQSAAALCPRFPEVQTATPVDAEFARPVAAD